MNRYFLCLSVVLVLVLSTANLASQVSSGRINGTVTDSSGAVISGAKVTAKDTKRDIVSVATTGTDGSFVFPSLQPSLYQISVESPGFSKAIVDGVELNVSATINQLIRLEVGALNEQVVVTGEAVSINTSDAQIGRNVTMKDIDTLPQLGRNPMVLSVFQPGVSIDPGDSTFSRVNGARQGSNNAKLDGIDVNDAVVPRLGLSLTSINTDSVEEFRMITNGAKAEYGRNAGGQLEMITRTGTNKFHGAGFEYLRNTELNANTFFNNASGLTRPKFIQNIFGGNFSGPVFKDKTFFSGNYQGRRTSQDQVRNRTVPTAEAKAGLFRWRAPDGSGIQTANIVALDPLGRGIDPFVKKNALDVLPLPNNADLGDGLNSAGFRFNNPAGSYEDQFTIKVDHQLSANHRIFYRHSWQRNSSIDALNNADAIFPGQPQGTQGGHRWGYAIGSDWAITPTLINDFRLGHQSANVGFVRPGRPAGPALNANGGSWTNPINPAFAQGRNSPVYDFTDNLTKIAGKHTIKMGYSFRRVDQYGFNDAGIYQDYFTTRTSGNIPSVGPTANISSADRQRFEELYNDLLGRLSNVNQTFYSDLTKFQPAGTGRIRDFLFWDHALFVQDDWKVSRSLTLNLGLRYELFGPPTELSGFQGTVDAVSKINTVSQIDNMNVVKQPKFYDRDKNDFAPRFGFAWDPSGKGKFAIRGSYGLFYDRIVGATTSLVDGNTPGFSQQVQVFPNAAAGSDVRIATLTGAPAQPSAPILQPPSNRQVSIVLFNNNIKSGYVHQFNFTVQRELVRSVVIDLGWVRSSGHGLFTWLDMNQPRAYGNGFLTDFNEMARFVSNANNVPGAGNAFVRLFGSPAAAVTSVGATTFSQGLLGAAADTVDRTNYTRYAPAGISNFYLRNFPQWNQVILGTNNGRSWYDSFQMSFRRQTGALKIFGNYTWSKNLDNISVDGNGFTATLDNYNLNQFRGRSDVDRPHVFNGSVIYTLPVGTGKFIGGNMPRWMDGIVGGWDIGSLVVWQSGTVFTVSSQRRTGPSSLNTFANFTGDRNLGAVDRRGNGAFYWANDVFNQFTFPGAGEFGTSGRNAFRGPRYFNTDISIVKRFRIPGLESHSVTFRGEMYNAFNNVNFGGLGTNITQQSTFGKFSAIVGNARIMQMALRYDF